MKSVFGRYIPRKGFFYNIDPRLKIIIVVFYVVFAFMAKNYIDSLILLIPLLTVYLIVVKKVKSVIKMAKFPIIMAIVIFLINLLTIKYGDVSKAFTNEKPFPWYLTYPDFPMDGKHDQNLVISMLALNRSIALFLRVFTMILSTTLLTNTTRPILLTKAIEDLMFPLKLLFIPTQIIAMIISIALRFIPTLLDESQRIMKAQSSRGIDFKNGKLKDKAVAFSTLIIPLFVSSFAKADDLSDAMQTRGYEPYSKRTKYRQLNLSWRDLVVTLFIIALGLLIGFNTYYGSHYLPVFWIVQLGIY
ncbi:MULTISPECIES: energy-coupling factor transporter transmembrane protein EcfT [unclassified Mycoplasma]|uniref:energy-coupling factor transporter transmembrane component T family protein n=1 Tax=unclassified Mycoplasma TaxID=2683645 RepID=UPI00211C9FDC|nr:MULTISPECIES: energy-coupling factor transporter transmembrane component T [unclassified Mycoplasma]UUM19800.1 energy-coupling factor transporter transmembrane protein EcfT [Mycoplasma sp. 1578d]UUM24784.1 energy-coupling factor transporter transmembrane protein EcfT [Mycoplasma sp. 3686d]